MTVTRPQGRRSWSTADEHPRADTSLESLAALRPIMARADPDATVTAGNASGQNDGAAVCVVTTPRTPPTLGLRAARAAGRLGASPASRRGRWASARCRRPPRRSTAPG